ncbi:bifunctional 4-hydroxy-3-methylbut-2-enyl diphosphate reductase/30S ribosomal protein S1 [Desulforamulus aquiferis]|uniref:4-hydroxy-3-methylbut-2-enyl diphosphate reductase n=1 Tax=Desulforamulus aquiferis TaxID=1397668 RepID=A0AAW7ZAX4_9FIRM|nr:bifunctional 4-hydroxy-3-methylbut-2-enyl diphosphate reductase/30S ribosomal protein S1 [Desulforamulus aquiferis]MDO7786487.1 bifunctional 4-hydroxy-3-methylbut-2-enyl diphosphate reductase/30S ribosomal protein S1 [Desulforamulus aquiferis]
MEVRMANKAGFCYGVKRAIEMALKTSGEKGGSIFTLGPIIHNPQVVKDLADKGINELDCLDDIADGTIIIRSHGVGPEILEQIKQKGLELIDATCPFVARAQRYAKEMADKNLIVFILGDPGHPEVQGILGWSRDKGIVVEKAQEISRVEHSKVGLVAQTTQPIANYQEVVEALQKQGIEVDARNTICHATGERQKAALELAQNVDIMVVVGGKNSANTKKLAKICSETGTPTFHVESAEELQDEWFRGADTVGLTAGASTPDVIIEEVKRRMKELDEMTNGEESMSEAMEVKAPQTGELVKGIVVQVSMDEVMVDVGAKSEGVIPRKELACYGVDNPQEVVKVGDEIECVVIKAEDKEGNLILSKERADAEKAWGGLEQAMDNGTIIKGVVREAVKGGLLVDVGVRAFLPASLVDRGYVEDLTKYLNQEIEVRVVEMNKQRKKVVVSRKSVLVEEYARKREELLVNLQEGQVVKGVVRRLTQFGAFVDLGGVDGLLHISEMSWHRINHPQDVVQVGDELEVMVLKIDRDNEKISLGLKQVLPNPWDNIEEKYPVGNVFPAKVVRLAPFGAFVQLEPGVEGLVHISHLADRHVAKPDEVVTEGEEVSVKVLSVDTVEKRIRLSIREVNSEPRPAREPRQSKQEVAEPKVEEVKEDNLTLGDVFGDMFKKEQ